MFRKILALVSLFLSSETFAQNLEAILSDTKLPVPVFGMPVVYDGQDSIYVLGGYGPNTTNYQTDILKFHVTTQTLEMVGTMDPVADGSAVWTGDENILYFGGIMAGTEYQSKVWSLKGANDWTQIGDLPRSVAFTSSVWDQEEYSYVFGGLSPDSGIYLNTISRFSSVTNSSVVVGELPGPRDGTSAIWDESTGDAYVFGGYGTDVGVLEDIVKFSPAENTVVKLSVTLPEAALASCAVWTGTEAYIIGGTATVDEVVNIVRFNPSTNEVLNIPVQNFPGTILAHGCAFVKKLNRIYVIGGDSLNGTTRGDEVRYIDLGRSSTNPTTTTVPTTTTSTPITTTTKEPHNEVGRTRFLHPHCWLLALFVCFQLY